MKKWMMLLTLTAFLGGVAMSKAVETLQYGQFSVSLNVKDIRKSHAFYTSLGFRDVVGDLAQNWIILTNDSAVVGLFQGEIEGNFLTFNPTDVRTLHRTLAARGIKFDKVPEGTTGPAHAKLKDPDGNIILLDQHN